MPVRIVHTADLHLDSPFGGLSPEQASARRRQQRGILYQIAEVVRRERADLLLMAGDLFDSSFTYRETDEAFLDAFGAIPAQVFIAPGNHDPFDGAGPYNKLELPENVHVFSSESISWFDLPALHCRVWGAGFMAPECRSLLEGFAAKGDGAVEIMVLHGDLSGGVYCPISREQIARSGLDYLALGHVHGCSGILREGRTFYAYPGCPEGRGFDEPGRKGVIAGTVDRGACALRFVPLQGARYESLEVDVTGGDPMARALAAIGQPEAQAHYRLTLVGETSHAPDPAVLEATLKDRCAQITVTDNTRVIADLWAGAGEDSLRGEFLARMERRCEQADPEQAERIRLAARFALGAMDGYDFPEMELP